MGVFDFYALKKQEEETKQEQPKQEPVQMPAESVQQFNALKEATTKDMVNVLKTQTVANLITTDQEVIDSVTQNSKDEISDALETSNTESKTQKAEAKFNSNKEACKVYGVEKTVPLWQQRLMVFGSSIWFVIYFIVATFTIAPIATFALKLNVIFKHLWVAILVAVLLYLFFAVGLPLIITHFS